MTAKLALQCDHPACAARRPAGGFAPPSVQSLRSRAKDEGWNSTRVPNPYYEGRASYESQTIVLDRCPRHARAKLAVEIVDDSTYQIVLRT